MTIAVSVNWCVYIVVRDEAARLGTVRAQTYREAYQHAARQFGVSPERQSRLFVRPIDRRVSIKARSADREVAKSTPQGGGSHANRTVVRPE